MVKDQLSKMVRKGSKIKSLDGLKKKKRSADDTENGGEIKVDTTDIRKRLMTENAFVSVALSMVYVQKHRAQLKDDETDRYGGGEGQDCDDQEGNISRTNKMGAKNRAANVSQLHEKLQQKLDELRGEHGGKGLRAKKAKVKLTKAERRQKSKLENRLKNKMNKIDRINGSESPSQTASPTTKAVYNNEGKMVFSKFDFANGELAGSGSNKKPISCDPKSALNKIKKQKDKIQSLEAIGKTDRVKTIEENTAWKKVMDKAEGVKVRDDETLLKKSIKRQDQKKKSSKKKWDARKEGEEKRKQFKQQKRNDNINKRKQDIKKNKIKKTGRSTPGFR